VIGFSQDVCAPLNARTSMFLSHQTSCKGLGRASRMACIFFRLMRTALEDLAVFALGVRRAGD